MSTPSLGKRAPQPRLSWRRELLFTVFLWATAVLGLVAADRVIGLLAPQWREPALIFEPLSSAHYHTTEFDYTASINSLGFRDHEFGPKAARLRIAALGDSFTFGWGVDLKESWPKVIEGNLRADGLEVEVANLGVPGGGPAAYAAIAERAVPALRPDLVVVGILQGDDLAQMAAPNTVKLPTNEPTANNGSARSLVSAWLHRIFPNLMAIVRHVRHRAFPTPTEEVKDEWRREAAEMRAAFSPILRAKYDALDPGLRSLFERGELNPWRINSALRVPGYFFDVADSRGPGVPDLVRRMTRELARIKAVADQYHARVVVVSVPFSIYVDRTDLEELRRFGFHASEDWLVSDSVDQEIRDAADGAGLPFCSATAAFRQHQDGSLFFPLDTHLNSVGHRFFADSLTPCLERAVRAVSAANGLS
jgi:lysophospholipase L1-like esterase